MAVEKCCLNFPRDRCCPVSSGHADPIVHSVYSIIPLDESVRCGVDREFSISDDCHVGCNLASRVGVVNENGERFCP